MSYNKWIDIKRRLYSKHDLWENAGANTYTQFREGFVKEDELIEFANNAIEELNAMINNLYEDYYLTNTIIPLVADTGEYFLPENIYADKIRKVFFIEDNRAHEVTRAKDLSDIKYFLTTQQQANKPYKYILLNQDENGTRLRIFPTPKQNFPNEIHLYYIRDVIKLEYYDALGAKLPQEDIDNQRIDVNEFGKYIFLKLSEYVYEKEKDPMVQKAITDIQRYEQIIIETLSNRVPDENDELLLDKTYLSEYHDNDGMY